jgi:hypothetical protein
MIYNKDAQIFTVHTWIVLPFIAVTTSPGRVAVPLGIFSHKGINAAIEINKTQ